MVNIAGFDTGNIGGILVGWATSIFFWIIVIFFFLFVTFIFLYTRKRRRFEFPCLEIIGLGEGKIRVEETKCGWFKTKKMLFGLLDYGGEDELLAKSRISFGKDRRVLYASSEDYHEINGKRGIICKRKDDDPEILVPLNKFKVTNYELLAEIAPADYRDAGVKIMEDKRKETLSWWDENKSTVLMAGTIVFAIIAIILVLKFAQGESGAWRDFASKALQNINIQQGNAP